MIKPVANLRRDKGTMLPFLGHLRLGDTVEGTSKSGKEFSRPVSLETWRFVSRSRQSLESVAARLGGRITNSTKTGSFELVTTAKELDAFLIPSPDEAFWQQNQLWDPNTRTMSRRCDGTTETSGPKDRPCLCAAERARDPECPFRCKIVTRIRVMMPWLSTGYWQLETRSYEAGEQFPAAVEAAFQLSALAPGRLEPFAVRLSLHVKTTAKGRFVLPFLEVLSTIEQVQALRHSQELPILGARDAGPLALPAGAATGPEIEAQPAKTPQSVEPGPPAEWEPDEPEEEGEVSAEDLAMVQACVAAINALHRIGLPPINDPVWRVTYLAIFGRILSRELTTLEGLTADEWGLISGMLEGMEAGTKGMPQVFREYLGRGR